MWFIFKTFLWIPCRECTWEGHGKRREVQTGGYDTGPAGEDGGWDRTVVVEVERSLGVWGLTWGWSWDDAATPITHTTPCLPSHTGKAMAYRRCVSSKNMMVRRKCLEEKELWIRVWKHGSLVHDNDFLLGSGVTPDSHFTSLGCSTLILKMRGRLDDS